MLIIKPIETFLSKEIEPFKISLETFKLFCIESSPYKNDPWFDLNDSVEPKSDKEADKILRKYPFLTVGINELKLQGKIDYIPIEKKNEYNKMVA